MNQKRFSVPLEAGGKAVVWDEDGHLLDMDEDLAWLIQKYGDRKDVSFEQVSDRRSVRRRAHEEGFLGISRERAFMEALALERVVNDFFTAALGYDYKRKKFFERKIAELTLLSEEDESLKEKLHFYINRYSHEFRDKIK